MKTKEIGKIGIDKVKIGGWEEPPHPNSVSGKLMSLANEYNVKICPNKAVITLGQTTVVFAINNKTQMPYVNVEVKATVKEPNLEPLSVDDVKAEIARATQKLYAISGINLRYTEDLKISKIEINTTFPLAEKYCAYGRILSLIALVEVTKGNSKQEITSKDIQGCFVAESLKCPKSTIEFAVYNKRKEMEDKEEALTKEELMRTEFRFNSQSAIISNFKTEYLNALTDEQIYMCFRKRVNKIFAKIDAYLNSKMLYAPNQIGVHNTVANMMLELNREGKLSISELLSKIGLYESHYAVPCILDINDCRVVYRYLAMRGYYQAKYEDAFMNMLLADYQSIDKECNHLMNQRILYDELRHKMMGEETYPITIHC